MFALEWQSQWGQHRDEMWTDQVNMWRDIFPPELVKMLLENQEGNMVETEIPARSFFAPYSEGNTIRLPPRKFYKPNQPVEPIIPRLGRYYPQLCLHSSSGSFLSTAPARCISIEDDMLRFDLNHPLAGYDLTLLAEIQKVHSEVVERGGRCEDWLERLSNSGPGMQVRYGEIVTDFFEPENMQPNNTSPDPLFYDTPRMVQHLDSTALKTITGSYEKLIKPGARVLDLMGSWDSHLSGRLDLETLTVVGMNQQELNANERATDVLVQDLNQKHNLPFKDGSFDAILCTASIEYLTDPLAVFTEMQRLLVPSGVFALAFSNRWFPGKEIQVWSDLHDFERLGMVMEMFQRTSGFTNINTFTRQGEHRPKDDPHPQYLLSDPVYMAWAFKK